MRFVCIQSVPADIVDPLRYAAVFVAVARVEILLCEIAVFIEGLPVPQRYLLTFRSVEFHLNISREILPEIYYRLAVRGLYESALKALLFNNGDTSFGTDENIPRPLSQSHTVPVFRCLHARVVFFALLKVVETDRSALGRLPAFVGNQNGPVPQRKSAQKGKIVSVVIAYSVDTDISAVPSVAESHLDQVFSGSQQFRDVIYLILQALLIVVAARSQYEITNAAAVYLRLIQAVACDEQSCWITRFFCRRHSKRSAQYACRLALIFAVRQFGVYPYGFFKNVHFILKTFR